MRTLVLSGEDIGTVVREFGAHVLMDDLIVQLSGAFSDFDDEAYEIPIRTGFHYDQPQSGLVEWMPLMRRGERILMKMVGYHPHNPGTQNLPTILSTLALFDTRTGRLEALADGTLLTALRTGAASAIASRLLANPESTVLGLIGCGAQAVTQLHALSRVFPLERVLVYDIDPAVSASFAGRVAPLDLGSVEIRSARLDEVVSQADILCVATAVEVGVGSVFNAATETKPWLHINAIGADLPGKTEIPLEFLNASFVCPDFRMQAEKEGECQQLDPARIGPEIIDVVRKPASYDNVRKQRSVYDSTGFALEDLVVLEMMLQYAADAGVGTAMTIGSVAPDPHNPYDFLGSSSRDAASELTTESQPSKPVPA